MAQTKTLGGDRLGSGSKQKVELKGYERSTHDLGYLWRSTMAAGTLVPFMSEVALPGDTFDINLGCDIKTHPTIGPLFGSYKVQLDVFQAPIRLYQGQLHNNKLGIGMNMSAVKLPVITLTATKQPTTLEPINPDFDNYQINPSCILAYLGIRGVAFVANGDTDTIGERTFNGIPLLAYWDIYKNYYANKQEEIGVVIHTEIITPPVNLVAITIDGVTVPIAPSAQVIPAPAGATVLIDTTGTAADLSQVIFNTNQGEKSAQEIANPYSIAGGDPTQFTIKGTISGLVVNNWRVRDNSSIAAVPPTLQTFDLIGIDNMREAILVATNDTSPFSINAAEEHPYDYLLNTVGLEGSTAYTSTQEGLGIKTYQSDLFNNWLNTEWIDDISALSAVSTAGDEFTIDALNLAKKVYDMFNRIAVSGGTYDDWLDVTYDHDRIQRAESPIYQGGLSKELVFQEVVSNSGSQTDTTDQPLGTLAGRGMLAQKHKGGSMTIRVDEPSYIMGIVSLTPRIDYSQGNKWDVNLATMDDFHKPALDEIGFQELIEEQMAWWTTSKNSGANTYTQVSAGKQPAWINYMTNVNQVRGNFAIQSNEMFMTLTRRYEANSAQISDLTTYIDPVKFNHIFAETQLDAQNFWVQIAVDITARRKMSAKIMPNL